MANDSRTSGLDGLRCYAALCVIFAHSKFGGAGWGATGVWLFFTLSGFLLAPGIVRSIASDNWQTDVPAYFVRRLARILPAYIFVLAVYCDTVWLKIGSVFNAGMFWEHVTFQTARWQFWTVKTEGIFYLGLPIIMMAVAFIDGWKRVAVFAVMIAAAWYVFEYRRMWGIVAEPSSQQPWVFFVTPFLIGCAAGLCVPNGRRRVKLDTLLLIGASALVLLSDDLFQPARELIGIPGDNLPWRYPMLIYPFAAMVVVGATGSKSFLLNNRLVIAAGLAGYSIYLWQSAVLYLLKIHVSDDAAVVFSISLPIILALAIATYYAVELPGQFLGGVLARWMRSNSKDIALATPVESDLSEQKWPAPLLGGCPNSAGRALGLE